jgi:hypothetical protein
MHHADQAAPEWYLERIEARSFLGMHGIEPLLEVWHKGELVGYAWPSDGGWYSDHTPNLRPPERFSACDDAVRGLLRRAAA